MHDRALVHQAEIAKRIRVGFSKTLQHHIVLPLALVAVGLHVGARRSRKVAKAAQHFIGATWNEARRDNWPNALLARAANGFDFLNKRRRVTHSLRRRGVAIIFRVRGGVVHDCFADKCALALFGANRRELDARFQMRASQIHSGRRARASKASTRSPYTRRANSISENFDSKGNVRCSSHKYKGSSSASAAWGHCGACTWISTNRAGQNAPPPSSTEHAAIAIRFKKVRLARVVTRHNAYDDAITVNLDKRVFQILKFAIHGSMKKRAVVRAFHFLRHETPSRYSTTP